MVLLKDLACDGVPVVFLEVVMLRLGGGVEQAGERGAQGVDVLHGEITLLGQVNLACAGDVAAHDGQAVGHRLEHHHRETLVDRWQDKAAGMAVELAQVLACGESRENDFLSGIQFFQLLTV